MCKKTEGDLHGNRPEDAEIEVTIVLTAGEIADLVDWHKSQCKLPKEQQNSILTTVENIIDQLDTYCPKCFSTDLYTVFGKDFSSYECINCGNNWID